MILTGNEIIKQEENKNIDIRPFHKGNVNPNSYNYRLDRYIKKAIIQDDKVVFETIDLMDYQDGYILEASNFYLANTYENIGSSKYAMSLIGRSSLGRLGMFLQVSANLGHTCSSHHWTLEIVPCINIKVYYKMIVGQVSFWTNDGALEITEHIYNKYDLPTESFRSELKVY